MSVAVQCLFCVRAWIEATLLAQLHGRFLGSGDSHARDDKHFVYWGVDAEGKLAVLLVDRHGRWRPWRTFHQA